MKKPFLLFFRSIIFCSLITLPVSGWCESKADSEKAGAQLFREKGCTHCHGAELEGTPKGPALKAVRKSMKAPAIANQIENGGQNMPPFGDSLSHDEIGQLVLFLRAKHPPAIPEASH